jgi:hypothetical protein
MPASYLIFDFAGNEDVAQQAGQRIEQLRHSFRLGDKLSLKFDREEKEGQGAGKIRVLVRVDFSDHEKLSRQRWLERIPGEEPFKSVRLERVGPGDSAHAATEDKFRTLAGPAPLKTR